MKDPIVSISIITYNQKDYVRDALDSFLVQRDVPFEILIHDDASTDGTEEIIREYEAKYPDVIRALYEKENQYSKGISNPSGVFNFPRARGRYIAFCEGDDYWTDPYKLKKQVEYMDMDPDCVMCCHSAKEENLSGVYKSTDLIRPWTETKILKPEEVISHNVIIPSASMMFSRKLAQRLPEWYFDCPIGDASLHLFMLLNGHVFYMDTPMSVYRTGRPGSWTTTMNSVSDEEKEAQWEEYYQKMEKLYHTFDRESGGKYAAAVDEALRRIRFHTSLNEGRDEVVMDPENEMFIRELPEKEAKLLRMRARTPGLYNLLRKTYKVFTKK